MAYNKSKYVESAQKLLNQGKVTQAIGEYQQILKYEPRDQVTLMTIGELYIRQGETFQAIDYFERLAQIFFGDGFLTKAIAVYKRIAKLAPEEIRPLEKLADLYVQQGVMSEARPLFLQLAEIHLKNNRQTEAIGLLKKLLLAEPDNLRIQIRLADLYQAMGQPKDAIEAYVSAAQRALARGDQAECEKLADKALKIEPNNQAALTIRARSAATQGNLQSAAQTLEHVSGLEKGGEQAELLLDLYLKALNWDKGTALAMQVFEADAKNYGLLQKVLESLLESGLAEKAISIIDRVRMPMIDGGEHEVISKVLNEAATRLPGNLQPLEWLVDMYGRTSDSFRLPDALAKYGDALVAAKQYNKAKEILEQLVDRQPESESAKRKLDDCLRKMGLLAPAPAAIEKIGEAPEEPLAVALPKAPAPKVRPGADAAPEVAAKAASSANPEPELDEETQKFIAQSLTDVDLFASYGLTQKAIGLLEAILRRAPRHTPTLEKLLDFVLGAGDDRRTAELAAQLERIHTELGDTRGAERFGELRRRFQRAAGLSDEELAAAAPALDATRTAEPQAEEAAIVEAIEASAVPEIAVEPAPPEVHAETPQETASQVARHEHDQKVHEVDLSDEWASLLDQQAGGRHAAAPPPPAASSVEEFAIPVQGSVPGAEAELAEFAVEAGHSLHKPPHQLSEISTEIAMDAADEIPTIETPSAQAEPQPAHAEAASELELDRDLDLAIAQEALVPAYDQKPPATPAKTPQSEPGAHHAAPPSTGAGFQSDDFLKDLAAEIDQLGIGQLAPTFSEPSAPSAGAPSSAGAGKPENGAAHVESGPLKEVFEEFRAELGEMGAEDEDLETHYNLGIAFREMGLIEEAISEFQKVAKATDRGRAFRYTMQCCTLLGLAFMEKGQPAIAAIWYERALKTPGVEPESAMALRYDLGVAQESAGEPEAALKSFALVYATNIDYRDVAERIAALQKPTR